MKQLDQVEIGGRMNEGLVWKARFFTVWTGQQLWLIGSRIAQFALVWWVTEKTGSATVLATATMVALLPRILLGPIIGSRILIGAIWSHGPRDWE